MPDIKEFTIYDKSTVEDCIKKLDDNLRSNQTKIVVVIDKKNNVKGTVTDGDIRRGLIKKIELSDNVTKIMKKNPIVIVKNSKKKLPKKYENFNLPIPIVSKSKKFIELYNDNLNNYQKHSQNTILLMAGGFGKRLKPITNSIPKPMIKIGDKPILEIILNNFKKFGFQDFIISVHYKSEIIKKYFGNGKKFDTSINYIHEKKPLGTAGVLKKIVKKNISFPIILMNSDVLTNVNFNSLIKYHKETKNDLTICTKKYSINIPYGVVEQHKNRVSNIIEKPNQKFDINAGIYVISKKSIKYLSKYKFIDMDKFIQLLLSNNKKIGTFPLHEYWLDIGKIEDFKQAKIDISSGVIK